MNHLVLTEVELNNILETEMVQNRLSKISLKRFGDTVELFKKKFKEASQMIQNLVQSLEMLEEQRKTLMEKQFQILYETLYAFKYPVEIDALGDVQVIVLHFYN